jgi:hypothetical protein
MNQGMFERLEGFNIRLCAKGCRKHLPHHSFTFMCPDSYDAFSCVVEYIHIRKRLITPLEFGSILLCAGTPSRVRACVEACRQHLTYGWDRFDDRVVRETTSSFSRVSTLHMTDSQMQDWASLLTDVIARGYDTFSHSKFHHFTGNLKYILSNFDDPDDAWCCACRWIDMLEQAQVDVPRYLEVATKYCFANWVESEVWSVNGRQESTIRRVLLPGHHNGRIIPYWIERADSSCPIHELLNEFPSLRRIDTMLGWGGWSAHVNRYRRWKTKGNLTAWDLAMSFWPIAPSLDGRVLEDYSYDEDDTMADHVELTAWANRVIDLRERRFERKARRRLQKLNGRGNGWKTMPGAWVE